MKGAAHFLLLSLLLSSVAFAQPEPSEIERDLEDNAPYIVIAQCVRQKAEWNKYHTIIYTPVLCQPLQRIKGTLPRPFTVLVMGGEVDKTAQVATHQPTFQDGEKVKLYLYRSADGFKVYRGVHGKKSLFKGTTRGGAAKK